MSTQNQGLIVKGILMWNWLGLGVGGVLVLGSEEYNYY